MKIRFITAVNAEITRRYAESTLKTWQWEPEIYHQEQGPLLKDFWQWRETQSNHPEEEGRCFEKTALRFSYKVEAQCYWYQELVDRNYDYMVWLDADVVQLRKITDQELKSILPREEESLTYLGRGPDYHPETGFIAYNLKSQFVSQLLLALRETYTSNHIYTLDQWHDAYLWEQQCQREPAILNTRRSLGPNRPGEAFQRSLLKEHWVHLKGDRKQNADAVVEGRITPEQAMQKPRK